MRQAPQGFSGNYNAPIQDPAHPVGAAGNAYDAERLSNLKRAVDSIEQRMGQQAQGGVSGQSFAPYPSPQGSPAQPNYWNGPNNPNVNPNMGHGSMGSPINAELGLVQEQLARLSNQIAAPVAPQPSTELNALAAEVALRQQSLNAPQRNASKSDAPAASPSNDAQFKAVSHQLSALKREILELKKQSVVPAPGIDQNEIDRIANGVAKLNQGASFDEAAFDKLNAELAQMRETMNNDIKRTVRREIATSNGNQANELTTQLDALSRSFDNANLQSANAVTPRVEQLANQIDALRVTVDDLPQTLAISRLETQMNDLVSKFEGIEASKLGDNSNVGPDNGVVAKGLESIEGRLDEVARALVAVSNSATKAAPAEIDLSSVERVEARIADLSRAVDELSNRDTSQELTDIAVRIDGLTERLGSFEKYAEAGDLGGASAMFAAPDIGVIEEQLRLLNARLDETAAQTHTGQLEEHIRQLSQRMEEASNIHSTAAQMSNLEAQIGQIIRGMNKMEGGGAIDFSPMEARLGQLESQLVNSQNFSVEAAQQAAQQAVALMGANSEPGQIISALSQDLRALHEAAEQSNAQNAQTVGHVQQTLEHVVDRLASIETQISTPVQPVHAAMDPSAGVMHQAAVDSGYMAGAAMPNVQVSAPPLDPTDHFEDGYAAQPENHAPLEPGAAPNLDQMVAQASQQLDQAKTAMTAEGMPADPMAGIGDDVRPDAVAAARRALQATTAEMDAVKSEKTGAKVTGLAGKLAALKSGGGGGLRKPLIMGAAALLLAIIAFQGASMFMGGDEKKVAKKKAKKPAAAKTVKNSKDNPVKVTKAGDVKVTVPKKVADKQAAEAGAKRVVGQDAMTPTELQKPAVNVADAADNDKLVSGNGEAKKIADAEPKVSDTQNDAQAKVKDAEKPVAPEAQVAEVEPSTDAITVPNSAGPKALVEAAQAGDAKALFQVGMRYSDGNDVKRDMTEAAKWFTVSANKGFAPAQYSIGSLYEKGIGVNRDVMKAAQWYDKAAQQGNARAMHNLAVIYAMGNPPEVQPNMKNAVDWFIKAANFGIKDSQFNLGILYGQGMGVPQNLSESYKWFALAAKTGDSDARSKRDEVAKAMDPDDLDDARRTVNDWTPRKISDAVNRVAVPKEWQGRGPAVRSSSVTSSGNDLKQAQAKLKQRGFDVGTPDGLMGPKTKRAIMEFQKNAGIPITGRVDNKLKEALGIST